MSNVSSFCREAALHTKPHDHQGPYLDPSGWGGGVRLGRELGVVKPGIDARMRSEIRVSVLLGQSQRSPDTDTQHESPTPRANA